MLQTCVTNGKFLWEEGEMLLKEVRSEGKITEWRLHNIRKVKKEDMVYFNELEKVLQTNLLELKILQILECDPILTKLTCKTLTRYNRINKLLSLDLNVAPKTKSVHLLCETLELNENLRELYLDKVNIQSLNTSYSLVETIIKSKKLQSWCFRDSDIIILKAMTDFVNEDFEFNNRSTLLVLSSDNQNDISYYDAFWTAIYDNIGPDRSITSHGVHHEQIFTKKFEFVGSNTNMRINFRTEWSFAFKRNT